VYSASTSFFVPFLITFVLYAHIFVVLRRRLATMRMRRPRQALPPEMTSSLTTRAGSWVWSWRLRRRKRGSVNKRDVDDTIVAELSEEKSSSGGLEVCIIIINYIIYITVSLGFIAKSNFAYLYRCYRSVICLSICLSQLCIVIKRHKISRLFLLHTTAPFSQIALKFLLI